MKRCYRCQTFQPLENFGSDKSRHDQKCPECKQCVRARSTAYAKANVEKRLASCKKYRDSYPDRVKQTQKNAYLKDKSDQSAARHQWAKDNKETVLAAKAKYRASNRQFLNAINATRRAADGNHTGNQIKSLLSSQKYQCACCKSSIEAGYHKDHITPLKLGGSNDILNIQLLCRTCNLSKGAKDPIQFMQEKGFLL